MSLPVVYGTVGRVQPLLDPAILARFADLPQNGAHNLHLLIVRRHALKNAMDRVSDARVTKLASNVGLQARCPWSTCGSE